MRDQKQIRAAVLSSLEFAGGPRTAQELAIQVGITETNDTYPTIRRAVRDLTDTGHVIGSSRAGYRLLRDGKSVQQYLNSLLKRQMGISRRIAAVYDAARLKGVL